MRACRLVKVTVNASLRTVFVAPGISAPSRFAVEVTEQEPYDVALMVEVVGGRFVCTSFTASPGAEGEPITTEGLRRIPVATLVRLGAQQVAMQFEQHGEGDTAYTRHESTSWTDTKRLVAAGPTDETLRFVAFQYRFAYAVGEGPTKAVQERLGLPRSTAGRWVDMARKRGYLGAAEGPGKAGPGTERPGEPVEAVDPREQARAAVEMRELKEALGMRTTENSDDGQR